MNRIRFFAGCLAALAFATAAQAQSSNYWGTNVNVAIFGGNFNDTNHWSAGTKPTGSSESVLFTNQQAGYTVTFTGTDTSGRVLVRDDNVIFDLAGNTWNANGGFYMSNAAVTVTSSAGLGDLYAGNYPTAIKVEGTPAAWCTLTITNAKLRQYSATFNDHLDTKYAYVNVLGPAAELYSGRYYTLGGLGGIVTAADGGKITYGGVTTLGSRLVYAADALTEITIRNGSTLDSWAGWGSSSVLVGDYTTTRVNILTNSTWIARELTVGSALWSPGVLGGQGPYGADVTVDAGSKLIVEGNVVVGATSVGNGRLTLQGGSTMTVSNGALLIRSPIPGVATNMLVLGNSTIKLGGAAVPGALTNRGIMKASGTITGLGASPARVVNEKMLEIGSSLGTLTLENANLELVAGSQTAFEFSETGLDQVLITGGSASLLGSNLFSLAAGSAALTPGVKWGLGVYDFIIASNITYGAQYDSLTNSLLTGLQFGVDYRYGIVHLAGGLQALRLEFVPEPSTVLLLVGGGLVLWQVRRKSA